MSSFIQFIKLFISGNTLKGIRFRTTLSIILTFSVLIIEIAMYCIHWDTIPNMIQYDYDFSGTPNNICEKKWIWYNLCLQISPSIFSRPWFLLKEGPEHIPFC